MYTKETFTGCATMSTALRHAMLQSIAAAMVLPTLLQQEAFSSPAASPQRPQAGTPMQVETALPARTYAGAATNP